ncbi:lipocalin family protein [Dyella sp. 2HG41-7]|uniref:lipocalin family protein n=1 Tax=Dyella sp. 2HG41-7 TaxID=2883239 RepID=UPI001F2C29D4|nr:lipocalin family protein [Dyella sp. 2HG41-7]
MKIKHLIAFASLGLASATASAGSLPPIKPVDHVDLPRFMGNWYVIATIPTRYERNAWNAVETYTLKPDGTVYTAFRFNNESQNGPLKRIHSTGFVQPNSGNAVWGVQVFWPLKAQYIVAYLSPDYTETIVARDARDYTWVMARTPTVSPSDYSALLARVKSLGYDVSEIRKVPQVWPVASGCGIACNH